MCNFVDVRICIFTHVLVKDEIVKKHHWKKKEIAGFLSSDADFQNIMVDPGIRENADLQSRTIQPPRNSKGTKDYKSRAKTFLALIWDKVY